MLNEQQQKLLKELQDSLNAEQTVWLAGYVNGLVGQGGQAANVPQAGKLKVFFATETGNAKMIAAQLVKQAKQAGLSAQAAAIKTTSPEDLAALDMPVIFVTSTHGEGEPPEPAIAFFEALMASEQSLKGLAYAVLALGDSSYPLYCKAGRDLHDKLAALGAEPFFALRELDVDFAGHVPGWIGEVLSAVPVEAGKSITVTASASEPIIATGKGYSRLEPVEGVIAEIVNLNDIGSAKETYHIEIAYEDAVTYQPGDAAGIIVPGAEDDVPRLYSIASAPSVDGSSVHLTVALATHVAEDGSTGFGLCSRYLSQLQPGDTVRFFIQQNHLFRLPAPDRDLIMIGPGTGIAPFRAFMRERVEQGASGRHWLFFGAQHAHCDFLYQQEWIDYVEMGDLQRIDLAFSRDQAERIYVQQRMQEKVADFCAWLEDGASLYLCGNKDPMSHDVDQALLAMLSTHKGSEDAAKAYLDQLEDDGRYVKDVY